MGLFGPKGEREYRKGFRLRLAYVYGSQKDPRDIDDALMWLDRAIAKGYDEALLEKARIYAGGEGSVKKDPAYALKLRQQALDKGLLHAAYAIAEQYLSGDGVPRDEGKAFAYRSTAAKEGSAVGYAMLAECYIYGWGCAVVPQKANELLAMAERAVKYDWERSRISEMRGKLALTEAGGSNIGSTQTQRRNQMTRRPAKTHSVSNQTQLSPEFEQELKLREKEREQARAYFAPNAPGHSPEITEADDSWLVRCRFRKKDDDVRALIMLPSGDMRLKYALRFFYVPEWNEYYVELAESADGRGAELWQYVVANGQCWIGQQLPMDLVDMNGELGLDVCVSDLPKGFGLDYLNYR